MDISTFSNVTTKIVIKQTCCFVLKPFLNAHVIVLVLKRLFIKNVWIVVSTLQHFCGALIGVFCDNGCYFLRENPLCTTSAVSSALAVQSVFAF
ncbi:hypothetical protein AB205_0050530, partial [Aquarana catesbeiana]